MTRCFVAAPMPDEAKIALADALADVRLPGRVSSPSRWHVTLRFLGEIDVVTYERFLNGFESEDLGEPFRISVNGLGTFPGPRKARVVWAGIERGARDLESLAAKAEEAAVSAGLQTEDRPFRPHLTLSIVRPAQDLTRLMNSVPDFELGWTCDRVVVYRSHLGGGPARYEPLETYELT